MQPDEQQNQPGNLNAAPSADSTASQSTPQWDSTQAESSSSLSASSSSQADPVSSPDGSQSAVPDSSNSQPSNTFAQASQDDSQPSADTRFGLDADAAANDTPGPQVFVSPEQSQPSPAQFSAPQIPTQPMGGPTSNMPAADPMQLTTMPDMSAPVSGQPPVTPMPGGPSPKRSKLLRIIIIVVVVIVVAALGVFGWNKLQSKNTQNKNASDANKAAQSNATSGTTDVSKLANFSFVQPTTADLDGLIAGQSVNGLTVFGTLDGQCELGFGKVSQTDLPGTTIGDVVSQVIAKAKSTAPGITVTGPNTVAARVLKGSDGKKYSLPTVNYSFSGTQDSTSFSSDVTYSISQLSDGSHAVVLLECSDTTANDQSALSSRVSTLDPVANAITIQVQ